MLRRVGVVVLFAGVCGNLYGEVLMNPSSMAEKQGQVAVAFANSKVEYDTDKGVSSTKIERRILGGEVAFKVNSGLDAVLELGSIQNSQFDFDRNHDFNGDGYLLGGGVRALFLKQNRWNVTGYGLFTMIREDDTVSGTKVDVDLNEVQVGLVAGRTFTPVLEAYGGVEVVPYSEGEVKSNIFEDQEFEREDFMNLRVGANYQLQKALAVRAELAFLGEETFTVAGTYKF